LKTLKEIKPIEYYLNLNYPITLYHAEEGGYVAEIEDLPGCLTEGETLEEVNQRIEDARKGWIQAAYEDDIEIPLPRTDEEYSGKFMVRIPKYLHRRLAEKAIWEGISLNQYMESILSAGVSTQNVIGEIKAGLDKISKQIAEQGAPLVAYPTSYSDFRWIMEGTEQEPLVPAFMKIKNKEQVTAA
jgi:predicted RNase H-like HicB family nuclease